MTIDLLRHKPNRNYYNNIQRSMTIREFNKATTLYTNIRNDHDLNLVLNLDIYDDKVQAYKILTHYLRHRNDISNINATDKLFYNVISFDYSIDNNMYITVVLHIDSKRLNKYFDISIKDLDYSYEDVSLDDDINIIDDRY